MVMPVLPIIAPAKVTPTAMPSGRLWSVTARTSMVVFCRLLPGPSALLLFRCRWGIVRSKSSKNKMPSQNPATAGTKAHFPMEAAWSIAGTSRLHTDAATMTPAANPVRARCTDTCSLFFIKNTHAAPRAVPRNGIIIPRITSVCIKYPLFTESNFQLAYPLPHPKIRNIRK